MSWLVAELFKACLRHFATSSCRPYYWICHTIQLQAELAGESVHLLSHIPPGDGECLEGWARNYYRVVQRSTTFYIWAVFLTASVIVCFRFSDTITAQFFGHVHFDYFTVFYEDMHNISSTPIGVGKTHGTIRILQTFRKRFGFLGPLRCSQRHHLRWLEPSLPHIRDRLHWPIREHSYINNCLIARFLNVPPLCGPRSALQDSSLQEFKRSLDFWRHFEDVWKHSTCVSRLQS